MKKVLIPAIIVGAIILVIFSLRSDQASEPAEKSEQKTEARIGSLAPDFETKTYEGEIVKLSDFRGQQPVFLNFWASWCPFCVDEMPLIADVQEEFSDRYVTLMVNRGESLKTAKKFSDEVEVTGRLLLVLDPDDDIYGRYGGFAMPYSLFIDKNGVIQDIKLGPLQKQELREKIQKILEIRN